MLAASAAPAAAQEPPPPNPSDPLTDRGDQFVPKPAGTVEDLRFWFGPYAVPPGNDMNRFDLNLPVRQGFIQSIEPGLRNAADVQEISHLDAHIHHAHWLRLKPGHKEDNHTGGLTRWMFGTGDEETRADARPISAADPNGPVYGGDTGAGNVEPMIYMIHNRTSRPLNVYILLDVTVLHGSKEENERLTGRPHRSPLGVIFGRTYQAPRDALGDGLHETAKDDPAGPIEWVATTDGTLIGAGGHLHPGGLEATLENLGSEQNPCPSKRGAYGGTLLFRSQAVNRQGLFSTDFQMTITQPGWRAPIRKGDRLRLNGVYENREHAWYDVMAHTGVFIDPEIAPRPGCDPYLISEPQPPALAPHAGHGQQATRVARRRCARKARRGETRRQARKRRAAVRRCKRRRREARRRAKADPTLGILNRHWHAEPEPICGEAFGAPPCDRGPEPDLGPGMQTSEVTISNFAYMPGGRGQPGSSGAPARVKKGTSLRFVNADQPAGIRHTATTCPWPCNGRFVANFPRADGVWDSGTLGYDAIDGGQVSPVASTPANLPVGKYSYFCRIHPWMRGAFEVVE